MTSKNRWEEFAQQDAEFYILTNVDDESAGDRLERFYASGQESVDHLLGVVGDALQSHGRALEIGCGMGRISFPMSKHFEQLVGVDIAPTMIEKLKANAASMGFENVEGALAGDAWDAPQSLDFAYSWLVFQHIEDWDVIAGYIERLGEAIRPGGIACLQFDTRPENLAYRIRPFVPSALLPRTWKTGIRRIRRSVPLLMESFERCGFELVAEDGQGGIEHIFVLRRRV